MSLSLLLADDSPTIAKILTMALASEDYAVRSVLNARDAEAELLKEPPFFFLVDLTLPERNAYSFARFVKQNSKLLNTRVVLLASAFEPVDEAQYMACGADAVIEKPFDPAALRKRLRELQDRPPMRLPKAAAEKEVTPLPTEAMDSLPSASDLSAILGEAAPSETAPSALSLLGIESAEPPSASQDAVLDQLLQKAPSPTDTFKEKLDAPPPPAQEISSGSIDLSATFIEASTLAGKYEVPPEIAASEELSLHAKDLAAFFHAEVNAKQGVKPAQAAPTAAAAPAPEAPKEDLSASAQALAAFFSAEVESHGTHAQTAAPAPVTEIPTPSTLGDWSSQSAPAPAAAPAPTPKAAPKRMGTGASAASSPIFDTGGSTFRFAEDYIQRISFAFSGALDEHVGSPLQKDDRVSAQKSTPMYPHVSHDQTPAASAGSAAAPALSQNAGGMSLLSREDSKKLEQMIREEVQLACREIIEKVAWEVIPELAENLIKKELDRVMKEMEN